MGYGNLRVLGGVCVLDDYFKIGMKMGNFAIHFVSGRIFSQVEIMQILIF